MQANKERMSQEKRKREQDEWALHERLNRDRDEIAKQFEKDKEEARLKADEEEKRALELQVSLCLSLLWFGVRFRFSKKGGLETISLYIYLWCFVSCGQL